MVRLLNRWAVLGVADDPDLLIAAGNPLTLPPVSQPAPDLAVIDASGSNLEHHPGWAHFAVEVAHTSLRKDLRVKARIYAAARIPEYWVVDLDQGLVHVHRRPEGYAYLDVQRQEMPASLAPESVDLPPFDFGALRSTDTKGQPH